MTEPDSGSNIYAMSTTAKKVGDGYILKGAKTFVTNAPVADIFLVYARTGGEGRFDNISCFIVEKGIAGMSVGKPIEKMGLRTSPMAEVFFDNCRLPQEIYWVKKEQVGLFLQLAWNGSERLFSAVALAPWSGY